MSVAEKELEDFLVDANLVSLDEIKKVARNTKGKKVDLGSALANSGALTRDDLRRAEAHILGIPFISLLDTKFELSNLALVPEPLARINNIIAFGVKADRVEVAMLDMESLKSIDFLKKAGMKLVPHLTTDESMKRALITYQKFLKDGFGDTIAKDAASPKVVEAFLKHAILQRATDIHIEPQEGHVLVRYRIGGLLRDAMVLPKGAATGITNKLKLLASLKMEEKVPQEGRFKLEEDGETLSFRVATLPIHHGEKMFIRIVPRHAQGFNLEGLGLSDDNLEKVHKALNSRDGLILVSGPYRSGKTTTLYTMLDILNMPHLNISTIEDPVEYRMHRINQTQARPEIGFSTAIGLRALLRQEPDIVMVGEINDSETAQLAVSAAHTGHLVLAGLVASSPAHAVLSLKELSVDPHMLDSGLRVVIGQKLVDNGLGGFKGEFDLLQLRNG